MKQFVLGAAALLLPLSSLAQQNTQLQVTYLDGKTTSYQVKPDARLNQVLASIAIDYTRPDWSAARLGSQQLQLQLQRLQLQLTQTLDALENYAVSEDLSTLAFSTRQLQRQLNNSLFQASFYMGLPINSTRTSLEENPKLADNKGSSEFYLTLSQRPNTVEVFGLTQQPKSMRLTAPAGDNGVINLIHSQQLAEYAESDYVWRISIDGQAAYQPVAPYNRYQLASCYSHRRQQPLQLSNPQSCQPSTQLVGGDIVYVGFDEQELPGQFEGINQLVVRLLKHYAIGGR